MNHQWISLGPLSEKLTDFSNFNKDIGVYRATLNEKIVYIGKATELTNGGFRKRLRDYTRLSNSARDYPSGRLMYKHKDEVLIDILMVKRDESGILEARNIESSLIDKFQPEWNLLDNPERRY